MKREEYIIIGIAAVALAAILYGVLFPHATMPAAVANAVDPAAAQENAAVSGPSFLIYNAPWQFSPPVQNVMPVRTTGQIGQVEGLPQDVMSFASTAPDCGCGGFGAL